VRGSDLGDRNGLGRLWCRSKTRCLSFDGLKVFTAGVVRRATGHEQKEYDGSAVAGSLRGDLVPHGDQT
jgi:hypothetical protein